MKPRLNSSVFIYFKGSFSKEKVIALGSEYFIHSGVITDNYVNAYRKPVYYEDYGKTWFKTVKQIKQTFVNKNTRLIKESDEYYELSFRI